MGFNSLFYKCFDAVKVAGGPILWWGIVRVWAGAGYEDISMQLAEYLSTLTWIAQFKQTPNWVQVQVTWFFMCVHLQKRLNFCAIRIDHLAIINDMHFFYKPQLIWFNELFVWGQKQDQT